MTYTVHDWPRLLYRHVDIGIVVVFVVFLFFEEMLLSAMIFLLLCDLL